MSRNEHSLPTISENLIRRDLTPAQRAKLIAKRKAAYEAVQPETKNGAAGKGRSKLRHVGEATDRFSADTQFGRNDQHGVVR